MRNPSMTLVAACLAALASPSLRAQPAPTFDDVPFAVVPRDAGGTMTVFMDIWLPPGATQPTPLLIWIHGGGWTGGSHNSGPPEATQILSSGIAIASVGYRLSQEAIFPAQIHDVKGAVRFLRANAATYNINPLRIAAWGSSAGGHLAALLGTSGGVPAAEGTTGGNLAFSSRVEAFVDYFGPTDILMMNPDVTTPPGSTLDHDAPGSPESRLIGFSAVGQGIGVLRQHQNDPNAPYPQKMALVRLANSVTHVSIDDPPAYIAHGTNDTTVPRFQSQRLFDALSGIGTDVTLNNVQGAGHGPLGAATDAAARAFLVSRLFAPQICPGDATFDNIVDQNDLDLVLFNFGSSVPAQTSGDVDGNGVVDQSDLDYVLFYFARRC